MSVRLSRDLKSYTIDMITLIKTAIASSPTILFVIASR